MAKIFISFLGTSRYVACNYYSENQLNEKCSNVRFVQEATIKLHASDFDKFIILLTKEARKANWESKPANDSSGIGLHDRLKSIVPDHNKIEGIDIPDCVKKEELWDIFNIIFEKVDNGDELVIDVTHGFRMLPMLSIVVINYLKVLKDVKIRGIYYGALEALCKPGELESIRSEERNVPILDLISFSEIQDWSHAAQNLVKYGITKPLDLLVSKKLSPILSQTKGGDSAASQLRNMIKSLTQAYQMISAVRGNKLYTSDKLFDRKYSNTDSLEDSMIYPLIPMSEYLKNHYNMLAMCNDPIERIFKAVDLCIEYEWWQEGFTLLQENVINFVLRKLYKDDPEKGNNWLFNHNKREFVSAVLCQIFKNIGYTSWREAVRQDYLLALRIYNLKLCGQLAKEFYSLTSYRNDMNHGGFKEDPKSQEALSKGLKKLNSRLQEIVAESQQHATEEDTAVSEGYHNVVLVNFSNHLYNQWCADQKLKAGKICNKVIDLAFPMIDPKLTVAGLTKKADEYVEKILSLFPNHTDPRTVHVMGEQTFCYLIIRKLQQKYVVCIASTTERNNTEHNGLKQSIFKFVEFRPYPCI